MKATLGFIGLGAMGSPLVRHLLAADYTVWVFDLNESALAAALAAGARKAESIVDALARSDWLLTSLPSSDSFVQVAQEQLLPHAREGQVFIDLGTVTPPETRRLAAAFAAKGATLLDAPVSGGPAGAERSDLYIFVGGDHEVFTACRPLLELFGLPERITYCGPSGHGQVVKGVNQLMMGLVDAAYLETLALGVRAGVETDVLCRALGTAGHRRAELTAIATRVHEGKGAQVGVKFRELPYFLREAHEAGFCLPLTETLYRFCDQGERTVIDDNRPAPSFWLELMKARA